MKIKNLVFIFSILAAIQSQAQSEVEAFLGHYELVRVIDQGNRTLVDKSVRCRETLEITYNPNNSNLPWLSVVGKDVKTCGLSLHVISLTSMPNETFLIEPGHIQNEVLNNYRNDLRLEGDRLIHSSQQFGTFFGKSIVLNFAVCEYRKVISR